MKKGLICAAAMALVGYGYRVWISADGRHGFYTDGRRVVSFGGPWEFMLDFSGNYRPTMSSGTGWQIAKEQGVPSAEEARAWVTANAPTWTRNAKPVYTTPDEHLKTYGKSSGYTEFFGKG